MSETKYEIEESVLQGVVDYLARQPYREVYQVLPKLTNLKPVEGKDEEASDQPSLESVSK